MDSNVQAKVKVILTPPAHSISREGDAYQIVAAPNIELKNIRTNGGQCLAKKKPNDYGTGIPRHEMEALARVLLPEIQKFFESEEGQREFREWKEKSNIKKNGK